MSCEKRSMPNQLCLNEVEEHADEMVVSRVRGRAGVLPPQPAPRELPRAPFRFRIFRICETARRTCMHYHVHNTCVSRIPGFGGFSPAQTTRGFYAVNEHSVKLAQVLPSYDAIELLVEVRKV